MKKLSIIIFLLVITLITACSPASDTNLLAETANLSIEAYQVSTRTIRPSTPTPALFVAELLQGEDVKNSSENTVGQFTLTDVNVGTYTLKVTAYADSGKENPILSAEKNITIKPGQENKVSLTLNYIQDGTGTMRVRISWDGLTEGNQVYEAINEYKQLGFRAMFSSDNTPINGIVESENLESSITWADAEDFSNMYLDYIETGLAETEGTEIYFEIYTKIRNKIQKIAETFNSVIQIYTNLESTPDSGDADNFKLNADNIISYLFNVSDAVAVPAETNPASTLSITWTNPDFPDDYYPLKVAVKAVNNTTNEVAGTATSNEYSKADKEGSATIKNLSSEYTYSIYFQVFTPMGYSAETRLIDVAQPKVNVTGIEFTNEFAKSYVMGSSISLSVGITPNNATNKDYTLTVNGETQEDLNISFPTAGSYTIKVVSNDNNSLSDKEVAIVRLIAPKSVNASYNDGGSAIISWTSVESATGYEVYRAVDKATAELLTTINNASTSTTDSTIAAGHTYTYYVKACLNSDDIYDSDLSTASSPISVNAGGITVTVPPIDSVEFGTFLKDALKGAVLNLDDENDAITITIPKPISGVTNYKWILNKTAILQGDFETANTVKISKEYLSSLKYGASYETTNSLMLEVTTSNHTYSTTGNFIVYTSGTGNPGTIVGFVDANGNEVKDGDTIYYGEPIKLSAKLEGNTYTPSIEWESNEFASVEQDGTVTVTKRGDAVITAKLASNESIYKTITLKSYVPIKSVTVTPPHTEMIISKDADDENLSGVQIVDTSYTSMDLSKYINVIDENDEEVDITAENYDDYTSTIEWYSSDESALKANKDTGVIETGSTANTNTTITVKANDNGESREIGSLTMHVLKADITVSKDNDTTLVTGKSFPIVGLSGDYALSLKFTDDYLTNHNFSQSSLQNNWCLNGEIGTLRDTGITGYVRIEITNNGYTGTIYRQAYVHDYTITAVISEKDDINKKIAILSFTATS